MLEKLRPGFDVWPCLCELWIRWMLEYGPFVVHLGLRTII